MSKELIDIQAEETFKKQLMELLLGERIGLSVGNYLFVPPLNDPLVSQPDSTMDLIVRDNFNGGYVEVPITVDDQPLKMFIHISRMVDEKPTKNGINFYDIEKFNMDDLKIMFKDEVPPALPAALGGYLAYKKQMELLGSESDK